MEMKCPYCDAAGGLTATHRHLTDNHLDRVVTHRDEETNQLEYRLPCPFCEQEYRRRINPRNRNPHFLEEFRTEIALVAFDQMIYHLLEDHPAQVGIDPAELE